MELVRPVPPTLELVSGDRSALASARLHRKLTVEEAAKRAGLTPDHVNPAARLVGVAALSAALMALVAFVVVPAVSPPTAAASDPLVEQAALLPKPWQIQLDVLNGAGDITWTRQVASKAQSLAYTVKHVGRADRFDYPQSAVYYPPGGRDVAIRLARQLGFVTKPLPGGIDPNRLVVIVGPRRGPG
jgi:hypothetical protein